MKKSSKEDNVCVMPFSHMNVKLKSFVAGCWRNNTDLGDFKKDSLETIWNNKEFKKLRNDILEGKRPEGCVSCWELENKGVLSTRVKENASQKDFLKELIDNDYSPPKYPHSIELGLGTTCNQSCRHCSSTSSSKWATILESNPELLNLDYHFKNRGIAKLDHKIIDEIGKMAPYLKEVIFSGGEPLIQSIHYECIDKLLPNASNIVLSYNTNLTTLGLSESKKLELFEKWSLFKSVDVKISLDSNEKYYSYLRHGDIGYESVLKNIDDLYDFSVSKDSIFKSLSFTASIYNILCLKDFILKTIEKGYYFHSSLVQYPEAISIQNLPEKVKESLTIEVENFIDEVSKVDHPSWELNSYWRSENKIKKQINRIREFGLSIIDFMNSGESFETLPKSTIVYLDTIDKALGGNWRTVYPEYN